MPSAPAISIPRNLRLRSAESGQADSGVAIGPEFLGEVSEHRETKLGHPRRGGHDLTSPPTGTSDGRYHHPVPVTEVKYFSRGLLGRGTLRRPMSRMRVCLGRRGSSTRSRSCACSRTRSTSSSSDATGRERLTDLEWNVSGYIAHMTDNTRIWAERLVAVARGADPHVVPYDPDMLAESRHYNDVALLGATWSLRIAAVNWLAAVNEADSAGVVILHSERGAMELSDVVASNAHDAFHHRWDLTRFFTNTERIPRRAERWTLSRAFEDTLRNLPNLPSALSRTNPKSRRIQAMARTQYRLQSTSRATTVAQRELSERRDRDATPQVTARLTSVNQSDAIANRSASRKEGRDRWTSSRVDWTAGSTTTRR